MPEQRKWRYITINWEGAGVSQISRDELDKVLEIMPVLEGLEQARRLREKLNQLLGSE